jgi:hypothetical protein
VLPTVITVSIIALTILKQISKQIVLSLKHILNWLIDNTHHLLDNLGLIKMQRQHYKMENEQAACR